MPFRARLNPASLARRRIAAARYTQGPLTQAYTRALPQPLRGPSKSSSSNLLIRSYNTTPPNRSLAGLVGLFRSRRQRVSSKDTLLSTLTTGGSLYPAYDAYVESLSDPAAPRLSPQQLIRLMEAAQSSRKQESLQLLRRVYADLEAVHGVHVEAAHHRAMVKGLARRGRLTESMDIARTHKDDMGVREWVAIVSRATAKAWLEVLDEAMRLAPKDEEIYAPLLAALVTRNPTLADIEATQQVIEERGIRPGPWCEVSLARVYSTVDVDRATAIVDKWNPATVEDARLRKAQWKALIHVKVMAQDADGVVRALRSMDISDDNGTLFLLKQELPPGTDAAGVLRAVNSVQSAIGRDLSSSVWAGVISHVLDEISVRTAWEVYCNARHRTTVTSARLADTLISKFTSASPPRTDEALEVYEDLVKAMDADAHSSTFECAESIYDKLLNACIATMPHRSDAIHRIAKDMEGRGVVIPSNSISQLINVLMQAADHHQAAFETYMQLRNVSTRFTQSQYDSMIINLIKLSLPDSAVAPPEFVTQMMQDMRGAGYQPGSRILTALLASYASLGKLAKKARQSSQASQSFQVSALLLAIRDVHSLINLDPAVVVDVPLLTALMDAFSSTGAFAEAFDVWDELVRIRPTLPDGEASKAYSPAINVIIDTCGYAENLPRARRIWAWANRHNLAKNERNWAAWVECLCRMGKLDEALDVVCNEMGTGSTPSASKDTTLIMAKFSWRSPRHIGPVVKKLQQTFPQWEADYAAIVQARQK